MKKNNSLVKDFTEAYKQISKAGFGVEPRDVYLAYCALALCTIADKMTDGGGTLIDPGEENHDKLS